MNFDARIQTITSVVSCLVAAAGFAATFWQLSRTETTLRAANTYQVQKDGRELIEKIQSDDAVWPLLFGGNPTPLTPEAKATLWRMFNFQLGVYRQAKSRGLTTEYVASFKKDTCEFLAHPKIAASWDEMIRTGRLAEANTEMRGEWCGTR